LAVHQPGVYVFTLVHDFLGLKNAMRADPATAERR
jgi:hypothetical protein